MRARGPIRRRCFQLRDVLLIRSRKTPQRDLKRAPPQSAENIRTACKFAKPQIHILGIPLGIQRPAPNAPLQLPRNCRTRIASMRRIAVDVGAVVQIARIFDGRYFEEFGAPPHGMPGIPRISLTTRIPISIPCVASHFEFAPIDSARCVAATYCARLRLAIPAKP